MNALELATLGKQMRAAQRKYFQFRSHTNLTIAKEIERRFDLAVDAALSVKPDASQLFFDTDS